MGKEEKRKALFMMIDSTYPSANEHDTIYAWMYTPIAKPKGIVQVMHGYLEHSRRYLSLQKVSSASSLLIRNQKGETANDVRFLLLLFHLKFCNLLLQFFYARF